MTCAMYHSMIFASSEDDGHRDWRGCLGMDVCLFLIIEFFRDVLVTDVNYGVLKDIIFHW